MKKLAFIGIGILLLSAGSSRPYNRPEILIFKNTMPAVDSLYQATKKLEASTLRLDKIVTKIK